MNRKKAAEIVGYSRRKVKAIGCMVIPIMFLAGIFGWIIWKWYFFPLSIFLGIAFGSVFSILESKRIERITGFNIQQQQILYSESLAARLDPITQDLTQYKKYIDSLPD